MPGKTRYKSSEWLKIEKGRLISYLFQKKVLLFKQSQYSFNPMNTNLLKILILTQIFFSTILFAQENKTKKYKQITIHDFMEDYVESAEKKFKKGKKEELETLLKAIPDMALSENKAEWQEIVDKHLESGELLASCKACHSKFKKSYKKNYRKRLVPVPEEILK